MSLFAIGDLHLAISDKSKTMAVFGGWENYMELLEENWNKLVAPEDTVVPVSYTHLELPAEDKI